MEKHFVEQGNQKTLKQDIEDLNLNSPPQHKTSENAPRSMAALKNLMIGFFSS